MEKMKTPLNMEGRDWKGHGETFKDDGYVHYFGCGNCFMVDTCQNLSNCTL